MFKKLFNSKDKNIDDNTKHIKERISTMNLSDMRSYVRGAIKDFEVTEFGLEELMHKLTLKDADTEHFYINHDDMASKKKKAFDIIILVAQSRKITPNIVDQIQIFLEVYKNIIQEYDREFKEIYESRLTDSLSLAIENINQMTKLQNKMNILGE